MNAEDVKKQIDGLSEEEKNKILNLKELNEEDFEKVTGGLSGKAKLALAGLATLAVAGTVVTAHQVGKSSGDRSGYNRGVDQGFASGRLIGEGEGYQKAQNESAGEIRGLHDVIRDITAQRGQNPDPFQNASAPSLDQFMP